MTRSPTGTSPYLRIEELRSLRHLAFTTRRPVSGLYAGRHASPQRGHSVEFTDYREYTPGDELGDIDWKVYGRSDRWVVKRYEHQSDMGVCLLIDGSASIAQWQFFGPGRVAEVELGNGLIETHMNNARTHSAVQSSVPAPGWGSAGSDRLGFDGAARMIAKRFLAGGIDGSTHAYDDTDPVVGFTTGFDRSSNKLCERELHAESRSRSTFNHPRACPQLTGRGRHQPLDHRSDARFLRSQCHAGDASASGGRGGACS